MFGGFVFPFLAASYFWFPKVTGYKYNEGLGKLHFAVMLGGFFILTAALYRVGLMGMLRRIADYVAQPGLEFWNVVATVGGFLVGFSMLFFVINLVWSLVKKERVEANPWRSRSPEWQIPSPPPEENFHAPPVVVGNPYDYGVPGSVYVRIVD
jgi:cytochrome c oxidase subunit 1